MANGKRTSAKDDTKGDAQAAGYKPNKAVVLCLGLYLVLLASLFLYLVIRLWPEPNVQKNTIFEFGSLEWSISPELRFVLLSALMGCLGSLIHAMTSFASYVGNRAFVKSWTWWYLMRPFIGMPLALVFYFAVRGGFFTLNTDVSAVSPYGVAALSGLVGMFSKQAVDKLRDVFENLFKTEQKDQRENKLGNHSS
ncbi:MAG TPA: hypothetical protein VGB38_03010 [bacterium]